MGFEFSERHAEEYYRRGYTIFRQVIPASLLADLRRACEQADPYIVYDESAPKVRSVAKLEGKLDLAPFRAYKSLEPLNLAYQKLLTGGHAPAALDEILEVFFQPKDHTRCLKWHRDIREDGNAIDSEWFRKVNGTGKWFVKVNAPLYPDPCLFYMPYSNNRPNRPEELEVAERFSEIEAIEPEAPAEIWDAAVMRYVYAMPGVEQLFLSPGDVAVYQPNAFHIGVYWPSVRRATLQDTVWDAEVRAWFYDYMSRWTPPAEKPAA